MSTVKKITFLGTGTSYGIPIIACDCAVCASENPKNKRLRSSLLIELDSGKNILIDTSVDFRQQCLDNNVRHLEAILFTHCHADHVFGLDDVRQFNELQHESIPCYAESNVVKELRRVFGYAFGEAVQIGGGLPRLDLNIIEGPFEVLGLQIIPLTVKHGVVDVTAYRFGHIAYVTDCSFIPDESMAKLEGVEILILDALRQRKHSTHFNIEEAVDVSKSLGAKQTYFTHISHSLDHDETNLILPPGVELAYDGLTL